MNTVLNESMPGKILYLLFKCIHDLVEGFKLSRIPGCDTETFITL